MAESTVQSKHPSRGQYARSEGTRARILEAALAEAGRAGFQNTSVARIAARAEVAVGILNYHFGSKRELLHELMASQAGEFLSRLRPRAEGEDFFSFEQAMLGTYLTFLQANPNYVRLAEEVRLHDPDLYHEGTQAHVNHIVSRIAGGIARGELRTMDAREIRAQAYFMLGALTFLDRFLDDDAYPGDTAVVTSFIDSLRRILAA